MRPLEPVRFYVCDLCGHLWRQPPEPGECHRCGHQRLWAHPDPQEARAHAANIKAISR